MGHAAGRRIDDGEPVFAAGRPAFAPLYGHAARLVGRLIDIAFDLRDRRRAYCDDDAPEPLGGPAGAEHEALTAEWDDACEVARETLAVAVLESNGIGRDWPYGAADLLVEARGGPYLVTVRPGVHGDGRPDYRLASAVVTILTAWEDDAAVPAAAPTPFAWAVFAAYLVVAWGMVAGTIHSLYTMFRPG